MKKRILLGLALFCMLLCGLWMGHITITETKVDENNSEYQKVMSHLEVIAKEVHPTGTEANESVRKYLRSEFERLECDVTEESFEATAWTDVTGRTEVPFVNFLITIDVPDTTDGVMLVSHYDSTPGGPGAADDGISVAAMLVSLEQSMEAYKAGTLTNDMYYLFTDGEELGLVGARYFVNQHSDMKEYVKLVVNFEARGNDGALLMFQTSPNSNKLIRQLKKAVDKVDGFSVAAQIYETMPNDTDLTIFLDEGFTSCLNFAMIDGSETYHQATDTFENINRDSTYMYYETVTELAKYFSTADLDGLIDDQDAVYFPTIGGSIFVLSSTFANNATIILAVLVVAWASVLAVKKKVSGKELLKSLGLFVVSMLGIALFTKVYLGVLNNVVKCDRPIEAEMELIANINVGLAVAVCLLVTAITVYISKYAKSHQEYLIVAMIICALGGIALKVLFDSIIYVFLIPLFILLVQSIALYYLAESGRGQYTKWVNLCMAISMIVAMSVVLYPFVKVVFDCFNNAFISYYVLLEVLGVYLVNVCFIGNMLETPNNTKQKVDL